MNSRLQDTVNEELQKEAIEYSSTSILERHSLSSEGFPCESSSNYSSGIWKPASSSEHTDMDHVFSATLPQLNQLGVNMELDFANAHKATRVVVETARYVLISLIFLTFCSVVWVFNTRSAEPVK